MQSVEIRVNRTDLADTLSAMRLWLDHERCKLLHFRHRTGGQGIVVISAGFDVGDTCAESFRRQFHTSI